MPAPEGNAPTAQEEDLYALLNVAPTATALELRTAFRRLSQLYHPDKHVDPAAKATATGRFTRIKEAYELLSDRKLRRIYDQFGVLAARTAASPGLELQTYDDLAGRFREESGTSNGAGSPINDVRDAYFTVVNALEPRVDATGLVVALEEDGIAVGAPLAVISQVSMSCTATAYVSQNNSVVANYSLASGSGSVGELALTVRRQTSTYGRVQATAYLPLSNSDSMLYKFSAIRSLSSLTTMEIESVIDPNERVGTTTLSVTRFFDQRHTASVSWGVGVTPSVAFTWARVAYDEYESDSASAKADIDDTDSDASDVDPRHARAAKDAIVKRVHDGISAFCAPMGLQCRARMLFGDTSLECTVRRPIGRGAPLWEKCEPTGSESAGASVALRGQVGMLGWEMELGGGRRYCESDTEWSTSVAIGSVGVIWRLKMTRSGHRFVLPVVLVSHVSDAKTATAAAIATSLTVSAIQILLVGPWQARRERQEREEEKLRRADSMAQAKADSQAALELMTRVIQASIEREQAVVSDGRDGCGLLITRALYGLRTAARNAKASDATFAGREMETELVEVGDCVQALVEDSRVQVVSGTKSLLMGFWDATAFGDKKDVALRIWYQFRGEPHECLISDDEPLELPQSMHRI